ncbi:MAG: transcriptional regulator [Oscillatoriales cyanobacterium]|nr:MAG: transcriptional regulator [Oscillatoriales cyanobacterium]
MDTSSGLVTTFDQSCVDRACPIQVVLDAIGHKWSILILRLLFERAHRPSELMALLPGISSKTLTQRLRGLERHGLIVRRVFPEVPPHVEYELTAKGYEVEPVMQALARLGSRWIDRDPCACMVATLAIL